VSAGCTRFLPHSQRQMCKFAKLSLLFVADVKKAS
jgi:hypothetical protein